MSMKLFSSSRRLKEDEGDDDDDEHGGSYCQVETTHAISHFEHGFKCTLMETSSGLLHKVPKLMNTTEPIEVTLEFRASDFALIAFDSDTLKDQEVVRRPFNSISKLVWDHEMSAVRFEFKPLSFSKEAVAAQQKQPIAADFFTCTVPLSLEVEGDMKLRLAAEAQRLESAGQPYVAPETVYLGMFAGPTKPKPFQRKRPNLSAVVPIGKLPSLKVMHEMAKKAYAGSCSPVPFGTSRRPHLALDLVFLGKVTFPFNLGEGDLARHGGGGDIQLTFDDLTITYGYDGARLIAQWEDIPEWDIINRAHVHEPSGLRLVLDKASRRGGRGELESAGGKKGILQLQPCHLSHIMHSMEFFWNRMRLQMHQDPKLGSTHGREVEVVVTVNGEEAAPPPPPIGTPPITDVITGNPVKAGQTLISPNRRNSGGGISPSRVRTSGGLSPRAAMMGPSPLSPSRLTLSPGRLIGKPKLPLMSNPQVEENWDKVVLYSGWLMKRGGNMKKWLWRYFVLYSTAQGHWLAYYGDLPDVPVFCAGNGSATNRKERKMIDLCRVAYIRPVSNQAGTPANAFDIVTIERSWTLCAESPVLMQAWLRALTRGVNEDAAVYDDEAHRFVMGLCKSDESTKPEGLGGEHHSVLSLSAMGAMLYEGPLLSKEGGPPSEFNVRSEGRYICYTEFYRWSLCRVNGQDVGLSVKVFTDQTFKHKEELLFITSQSRSLAATIEHYIEKFMTIMHMKNEIIMHNGGTLGKDKEPAAVDAKTKPPAPADEQQEMQSAKDDAFDFSSLNEQPFIRRASLRKDPTNGNDPDPRHGSLIDFEMDSDFEQVVEDEFDNFSPAPSPARSLSNQSSQSNSNSSGFATTPITPPPPQRISQLRIDPDAQALAPMFPNSPVVPLIAPYQPQQQKQQQQPASQFSPFQAFNTAPLPPTPPPLPATPSATVDLSPTSMAFASYFPPTPTQISRNSFSMPLTPSSVGSNPFDNFTATMTSALPTATPNLPAETVLRDVDNMLRVSLSSRSTVGYGCSLTLSLTAIGGYNVSAISPSAVLEGPPVTSLAVIAFEPPNFSGVTVLPNNTVKLEARVKLLRPFAETPSLCLAFTCGGMTHTSSIPLPVHLDAFIEELPLSYDRFQTQWKNMAQISQCQFNCRSADPVVVEGVLRKLKFAPVQGIPTQVPGVHMTPAATLLKTGTAGASGEFINVAVLVGVETSAAALVQRVTVRSVNNVLTEVLVQKLKEALSTA